MTQKGIITILNNLKVAHEKFTWSGKEIPHIGSYGGHKWHGFWLKDLDAREAFPLSTEFRQIGRASCRERVFRAV